MKQPLVKIKSSTGKHPGGRPTKYKPEYCQRLIEYMQQNGKEVKKPFMHEGVITDHVLGYLPRFFEGFATEIDVTVSTLTLWKDVHPEFSAAYEKAKQIQLDKLASGTIAGVYNAAGAIFALKNMHRWTDRQELSGSKENPVTVQFVISKEEHGL